LQRSQLLRHLLKPRLGRSELERLTAVVEQDGPEPRRELLADLGHAPQKRDGIRHVSGPKVERDVREPDLAPAVAGVKVPQL
jgi:hypothetical protein